MDKYKLNDRSVNNASNCILDFILSSYNIKLEDENKRRKLIRRINTLIRAIKIDNLTKMKDLVSIDAIFHPLPPSSHPRNGALPSVLQKKANKKNKE